MTRGLSGVTLSRLKALGIPVEEQLNQINSCLSDIDKLLIPSTVNNIINIRFILKKERHIISIFDDAEPKALNYLVQHVKLGLLFYKVKDHRHFSGKHRTELIELLAMTRISTLNVLSRVLVLHALQMMKLGAHPRAEYWVRNILLQTKQDQLSELKTLTDAKMEYFCMNKLIFVDIRSESIRQDILRHFQKEAKIQQAHMKMNTKKAKVRKQKAWRKILSDVDDTLSCSGGSYPAGVDKRYGKKMIYPGVLSFYRELDLGLHGPEEWPEHAVGNLVFLSARPHVYKDVSEKHNFAKFQKLKPRLHTNPSLLAGDIVSGSSYVLQNDMEPLAVKKFENFKRYVSIYPEFKHIFIGDNGQGDVRAGELMFDAFPDHIEVLYVHTVKPIHETYGYAPQRWTKKGFQIVFFQTYIDAAIDAATRDPPFIRVTGLRRICQEAIHDFQNIKMKDWPSTKHYKDRLDELNQGIWKANQFIKSKGEIEVAPIKSKRIWNDGQKVSTPYGNAFILSYDDIFDFYNVVIDWRPIDVQVKEYQIQNQESLISTGNDISFPLETVLETKDENDDDIMEIHNNPCQSTDNSIQSIEIESNNQIPNNTTSTSHDIISENFIQHQIFIINSTLQVKAKIRGQYISQFHPPTLPVFEKGKSRSLFSFWATGGEPRKEKQFNIGHECSTPFGVGIIREHRKDVNIIVVHMKDWSAKAYLQPMHVQVIEKGILGSIFTNSFRKRNVSELDKPNNESPYSVGTTIYSPFGEGVVSRALANNNTKSVNSKTLSSLDTIGISLTSWTLADKSHPMLYCTPNTANEWKDLKLNKDKNNFFSVFGTIVSETMRKLTYGSSTLDSKPTSEEKHEIVYEQYFKDGASVSTVFGNGQVQTFRKIDGVYEVHLTSWRIKGNKNPKFFAQRDSLSYKLADGCSEGYPVLTLYNLTGILASVEPTTGVHVVTVPSAGMVCYFQPNEIIMPLKAANGEEVLTPYGEGTTVKFRHLTNIYEIKLKGWNATLFAKCEFFDRVDGSTNNDGKFGFNWLVRWMFFSSEKYNSLNGSQRSRTGSFSTRSVTSISARSISK